VTPQPDPKEIYARWLERGSKLAFAFALLALALYLSGALAPLVPLEELPRLWTLPAAELARQVQAPTGWAWLPLVRYGDYLNLLGISVFALLALVCTARVIPTFFARGERALALLAALQALVLLAAALHLFPGGS
jgi:hypothetical protein